MATRRNRKGRAMGGMLVGIRVDIRIMEKRIDVEEGMMEVVVEWGREKWRIIGVYVNGDIERKLMNIKERIENDNKRIKIMVGEDFNARIRRLSGSFKRERWGGRGEGI